MRAELVAVHVNEPIVPAKGTSMAGMSTVTDAVTVQARHHSPPSCDGHRARREPVVGRRLGDARLR